MPEQSGFPQGYDCTVSATLKLGFLTVKYARKGLSPVFQTERTDNFEYFEWKLQTEDRVLHAACKVTRIDSLRLRFRTSSFTPPLDLGSSLGTVCKPCFKISRCLFCFFRSINKSIMPVRLRLVELLDAVGI